MKIMPSLLDELYKSIIEYVANSRRLSGPPVMKRNSRAEYSICSGNFFARGSEDLSQAVNEVTRLVEETIKIHIGSHGELIKNTIRTGEIWDSGKTYFEIKGGSHFEVYCFTCKSLTFVRVQHERMLYAPEKEWLSIDVDENQDTLWLAEPLDMSASFSR
jgi:hypothetical protein